MRHVVDVAVAVAVAVAVVFAVAVLFLCTDDTVYLVQGIGTLIHTYVRREETS